jgi:hypothetical protein
VNRELAMTRLEKEAHSISMWERKVFKDLARILLSPFFVFKLILYV